MDTHNTDIITYNYFGGVREKPLSATTCFGLITIIRERII